MSTLFPPLTTEWTTGGLLFRLHLLSTGMGRDKTRFREARFENKLSVIDAILDNRFTEWLPIRVALLQYPEGIFLVDTGLDPGINNPDYLKSSGPIVDRFIRSQFKFTIDPGQTLPEQLTNLGIPAEKITAIILTHLHFDHIGGLRHFPKTPILLHRQEWDHPFGALAKLYPSGFQPTLLDLDSTYGPFRARFLTPDRTLALVHTPGHTPGHCSVLIITDTVHILIGGDIAYNPNQIKMEKFAANLAGYRTAKQTYNKIRSFARQHPLILITTHDPTDPALLTP
jgi:glyoxylase-like metal-dependent hydrolase (beta-lactamase superfamily II)